MKNRALLAAAIAAVIAAIVHLSALFPPPSLAADSLLQDLVQKGADLNEHRRVELRQEFYEMFVFNRSVDSLLAITAMSIGMFAWRKRTTSLLIAVSIYAVLNTGYLLLAWGILEYGLAEAMQSMLVRLKLQAQSASPWELLQIVARPLTLILCLSWIAAFSTFLAMFAVRRLLR